MGAKCTAQSPLITCRADKEEPEDDRALHRIPFSPVHSEVYLAIGVGSWHLHVVIEFERYFGTYDGALQEKQQHHDLALHAIDMCGRMGFKARSSERSHQARTLRYCSYDARWAKQSAWMGQKQT